MGRRSNVGRASAPPDRLKPAPHAAFIVAGLVALTMIVFAQVTSHSFLNYDDDQFVTANDAVLRGFSAASIEWAITSASIGWYPLTWLSHMLDVELWGLRAGMHLLMNALLHAVNGCLLFAAMRRLTRATWRSAFVAALFAIHPVIGIVQIGGQSMADRYTYFSYIGLFIAITFGALHLAQGIPRAALIVAAGIVIVIFTVLAFRQAGYWKDSETLFTHAIEAGEPNLMAEYNLGQVMERTRPDQSIEHLRRSIELTDVAVRAGAQAPEWYPQAYVGIATAMLMKARDMPPGAPREAVINESIEHNRRALDLDPTTPHAKNNIAIANQMLPQHAPRTEAQTVGVYLNEGVALAQRGKFDDAVARYRRAVELAPGSVEARVYLGLGLIQSKTIEEGVAVLRAAKNLDAAAANRYVTRAMQLPPDDNNLDRVIANYAR